MMNDSNGLERMQEAVELFLDWKARPDRESAEEFLEAHATMRELLEPLLEDEASAADGATDPENVDGDSARPRRFGDFRILRELGRGGMGVVYEAEQASLDRRVALKVLPAAFAQEAKAIARFKREATTAARLEHPGIVRVLAVGAHDDIPYYAMERIDGVPLHRVLHRLRTQGTPSSGSELAEHVRDLLDSSESTTRSRSSTQRTRADRWRDGYTETLVALAIDVCSALAHAHAAGIVHRDVKPSNLMLRKDGSIVLTDFGLAREYGLPSATLTGEFAGTPHYVSPEQARGETSALGPASDVFSFGATFYELLTLRKAFEGKTTHDVLDAIRKRDARDPCRHDGVPADLAAIVLRCMEKDPAKRYANCAEVQAELEAFRGFRPVRARRPGTLDRLRRFVRRRPLESSLGVAGVIAACLATYLVATQAERRRGRDVVRTETIERELELGFVETFAHRDEDSSKHFRRVLELDPTNAYALCGALFNTVLGRKSGDGHDLLAKAREQEPDNLALQRLWSVSLMGRGKKKEALAERKKWKEPYSAEECFVAGFISMPSITSVQTDGAMGKAASQFRRAIERSHRARLVHYMHWALAIGRAEKGQDVNDVNRTLEILWPDSAVAAVVRALSLHFHDADRSIALYERALEMDPSLIAAYSGLANAFASKKRYDEGITIAEKGLELDSEVSALWQVLASMRIHKKRFREAEEAARKAIAISPRDARHHCTLAVAVERNVDESDPEALRIAREGALSIARQASELSPHYERAHRGIAKLCKLLGDTEGERGEYLRWVRINPNGAWAHMEFARYLLAQEAPSAADRKLALRAAHHSTRLYKTDAGLMTVLARAFLANDRKNDALRVIARARNHLPSDTLGRQEAEEKLDALTARIEASDKD